MTRRGFELLARADAVVYDRLIPVGALDGARPDAELHNVGKRPGGSRLQEANNALVVELAAAGKDVVRLKGGDPFVFGRATAPRATGKVAAAPQLILGRLAPRRPACERRSMRDVTQCGQACRCVTALGPGLKAARSAADTSATSLAISPARP